MENDEIDEIDEAYELDENFMKQAEACVEAIYNHFKSNYTLKEIKQIYKDKQIKLYFVENKNKETLCRELARICYAHESIGKVID